MRSSNTARDASGKCVESLFFSPVPNVSSPVIWIKRVLVPGRRHDGCSLGRRLLHFMHCPQGRRTALTALTLTARCFRPRAATLARSVRGRWAHPRLTARERGQPCDGSWSEGIRTTQSAPRTRACRPPAAGLPSSLFLLRARAFEPRPPSLTPPAPPLRLAASPWRLGHRSTFKISRIPPPLRLVSGTGFILGEKTRARLCGRRARPARLFRLIAR